jgi:sulfite exporter TauE/SafE
MFSSLIEGLGLGLATGTYCLVGCVPILAPHYLCEKRDTRHSILMVGEFLLGRLVAYLLFGALIGAVGEGGRNWLAGIPAAVLTILAGLFLLAGGLIRTFPNSPVCKTVRRWPAIGRVPLLAGFVLGISPCPPFLAAASRLVALGSIPGGVILAGGFFLASSVYLLPVAFASRLTSLKRVQDVARMLAILTGVYFVVRGAAALVLGGQ